MTETWASLISFPGAHLWYEVSSLGRIRNKVNQHIYKSKTTRGYPNVVLRDGDGKKRTVRVCRAVLMSFSYKAGLDKSLQARHKDGDRTNNRLDNLVWGTAKDNAEDRIGHGTHPAGEKNSQAKLTTLSVSIIRDLYARGVRTQADLARSYFMSRSQIGRIVRGEAWA